MLYFDANVYSDRLNRLQRELSSNFEGTEGIILFFADFELATASPFQQESSFYYFTGITEPGVALACTMDHKNTLFVPNFGKEREKWVSGVLSPHITDFDVLAHTTIEYLGAPLPGYQLHPFFHASHYQNLIIALQEWINRGYSIFTCAPDTPYGYMHQRFILERLQQLTPNLDKFIVDISAIVAEMRRTKEDQEIALMQQAIAITTQAHESVAVSLHTHTLESDVAAIIEYTFISNGAQRAFPTIVGSGKNGTILHYTANSSPLASGDLVVVDIGARYNYYCADITRTYPISGSFTLRQREIYDLVLETQTYIAALAQPGMWLSNRDYPDRSLHHLAYNFLRERGYADFFIHGIGHFLGLDVHDVGNYMHPLRPNDVITIEPGIYIPDENIGVRIEDNYLIAATNAECLSRQLPKTAQEIEHMMRAVDIEQ